jgi:hypothetical protein
MSATRQSLADAITALKSSFSGRLLQSSDTGYEEARRVHNGLIDKRPALIAQCTGTADIVEAVRFARAPQPDRLHSRGRSQRRRPSRGGTMA